MTTITLKLPPAFIRDCIECGCDVGQYDNGLLTATVDQIDELRNRAAYYADDGLDAAPTGLARSAQTLLRRLAEGC